MTHCRVARIKFDHGRVGSRLTLRCLTSKPPSGASRLGSVVPLPRVASTTQTGLSSAQALLIDSGLATWQTRGATVAEDNRAEEISRLWLKIPRSKVVRFGSCSVIIRHCNRQQCQLRCVGARRVRCDADTKGRRLRASSSGQLPHISLAVQGVGDRWPGRLCSVYVPAFCKSASWWSLLTARMTRRAMRARVTPGARKCTMPRLVVAMVDQLAK